MSEPIAPLVSVGIPTYNQPGFLRQAIQSVLNQECQDFEIIVVDDCSTDNTADTVKKFGDPRIFYYRTPANLRPPRSWNYCVKRARGRFFALLPHDDLWLPSFITEMVRLLKENPDAGFAQCRFHVVGEDLSIKDWANPLREVKKARGVDAIEWQFAHLRCNPVAVLFDLKALRDSGSWRESYWDDWALFMRIAFTWGFCYTPYVHAAVRTHGNNLSTVLGKEARPGVYYTLDQMSDVFGHILPHSERSLALYSRVHRGVGISLFFTACKFLLKGRTGEAIKTYQAARAVNPLLPFDPRIFSRRARTWSGWGEAASSATRRAADRLEQARDQEFLNDVIRGGRAAEFKAGK